MTLHFKRGSEEFTVKMYDLTYTEQLIMELNKIGFLYYPLD